MTRHRSIRRSRLVIAGVTGAAIALVAIGLVVLPVGGRRATPHPLQVGPIQHGRLPCPPCGPNVRFFSPDSIWNKPLSATTALDPNSTAIVGNLQRQVAKGPLGIAAASYGTPIYTVGPNVPTVHVTVDAGHLSADLQFAVNAVPIPPGARPAPGTDGYLVVYQPSTDTMWEFWRLSLQPDGWHTEWGGRMVHVSTDPGYYRYVLDPQGNVLERPSFGAPATSLPLVGGTMTIAELEAGHIDHALALQVHNTCAGEWAAPAQRSDGHITGDPTCVPEGAHFRLDPSVDLSKLGLPHFVLMMAEAAQKYGIIVDDRTEGVGFRAEDPAQFQARYGYNPYRGPQGQPGTRGALFGKPGPQLVAEFPWRYLQLLKMQLRTQPDMTPVVETDPPASR